MKKQKTIRNRKSEQGFTLIELIAVVAILGIITYLATSSYKNRSEEAKQTAAMHDMQQLADAERQVEAYYGYYVPLNVLDDIASVSTGVTNADLLSDAADFLIVEPTTGQNPPAGSVRTIRDMLANRPTVSGDTIHTEKWKGPFIEFQRKGSTGFVNDQFPLDPWSGPYHFLSIHDGNEIDDRGVVGGTGFSINTIGRYAIVSWGRDSAQNTADDQVYTFQ